MATAHKAIPTLELMQIASPCKADWNSMQGNDRARHCRECNLNVYNLSAMTREEADSFLIQAEGRVCVRLFRRADGTVITRDCPVGLVAARAKVVRLSLAAIGLLLAFGSTVLASMGKLSWFDPYSLGKSSKLFIEHEGVMGAFHCPPPLNFTPEPAEFVPESLQPPSS